MEQCSAGDAHSAVLTTNRNGVRDRQLKKISTFGRGAHGRLGTGKTKNVHTPMPVTAWLPSLDGLQIKQVICGGAHTLALLVKEVPKSLANPWAFETFVAAWGFGTNGQLGDGYAQHSNTPVKVKFPRWEKIAEIAAGRSWSMARSISGDLFTWGKGLRGQLGQGSRSFCYAPYKIDTFASFLKLSSGYSHSVCIATQKRFLNAKISERLIGKADPMTPILDFGPEKRECSSIFAFDCCRTNLPEKLKNQRISCRTCKIQNLCYLCGKFCHRKHELILNRSTENKTHHCECGIYNMKCRVLPTIKEIPEDSDSASKWFQNVLKEEKLREVSVVKIQVAARKYNGKKFIHNLKVKRRIMREDACTWYYEEMIIKPIFRKFENAYYLYRETRELVQMRIEENLKRKYDYMYNLQGALQGIDAVMFGTRIFVKQICPMVSNGPDTVRDHPTYSLSWSSIRNAQLKKMNGDRMPRTEVALLTQFLPRYDKKEGCFFDRDVHLLTYRYFKDDRTERWRKRMEVIIEKEKELSVMRARASQIQRLISQV